MKKLLRLIGVVALLLIPAFSSRAATGPMSLVTSPLPLSLSATPGTSVTTDLRIKNAGPNPEKLRVGLLKFNAFGESGQPRVMDFEPQDQHDEWVKFSQNTFDAPVNEWQTIKMTINVPKTAAFGYYYAVTFARADADTAADSDDQQAVVVGATATLVLLEARVPNAKRDLDILEFGSAKKFYEYLPAEFSVRVRNRGNVHVAPHGQIFIYRGKKEVSAADFNAEGGNILPGTNRIFSEKWSDGFPVYVEKTESDQVILDQQGKQVKQLKWNFSEVPKLRIGKYRAQLVMVYDDGKRDVPVEATVEFWVVPWRLLIALIAVPVVPAALVYWIMQRRLRKRGRA
jgi:hypothetical protein